MRSSEELNAFFALYHCSYRAWRLVQQRRYYRSFLIPEIPVELSMYKQCVPLTHFSLPTQKNLSYEYNNVES